MLLDTNVLVRHVTGQPALQARRATAFLRWADSLELADLILAEFVYVLESVYERPRPEIAAVARAVLAMAAVEVADERLLLHAVNLYETHRVDFAEAYLAARAAAGDGLIASFDRGLDRVVGIERVEP